MVDKLPKYKIKIANMYINLFFFLEVHVSFSRVPIIDLFDIALYLIWKLEVLVLKIMQIPLDFLFLFFIIIILELIACY